MSLGGVAIFLSVLEAARQGAPFMGHPWLTYLGKITYGLYAYHYLGLRLSGYLMDDLPGPFGLALSLLGALLITFLLAAADRKTTRLNSSHTVISYAVFCLKKNKKNRQHTS